MKSKICRGEAIGKFAIRTVSAMMALFIELPVEESGKRHLFFATSCRYPSKAGKDDDGLRLLEVVLLANDIDK